EKIASRWHVASPLSAADVLLEILRRPRHRIRYRSWRRGRMEITRREFLAGTASMMAAAAAGGCASTTASRPLPKFAYVGCYTTKQRNGRGEGITVHRVDAATGAWTQVQLVKTADNPSWLTFDRNQRFLYSAHGDGEVISAFRVDE